MGIVADIMALPERDRLPAALDLLAEVAAEDERQVMAVRQRYDLSPVEGKLFCHLNALAPAWACRDRMVTLLRGYETSSDPYQLLLTQMIKLRRKLAAVGGPQLEVMYGGYYRLADHVEVEDIPMSAAFRRRCGALWTDDDDAELVRMWVNGSHISAIADELDRTERAILDRIRGKGLRR